MIGIYGVGICSREMWLEMDGRTENHRNKRVNMDDKTINLHEYKENKRQAAIQQQQQWEENYKQAVMDLAHTGDVKTTTYTTNDLDNPEVREKVMRGVVITEDRCVCCGKPVVEGRMVCEDCEERYLHTDGPKKTLPPKTWERTPEERFGKKKSWILRLFSRE